MDFFKNKVGKEVQELLDWTNQWLKYSTKQSQETWQIMLMYKCCVLCATPQLRPRGEFSCSDSLNHQGAAGSQ